jgi:hypothetical protein
VYANSENGNLYAISQSGKLKQNTFLQLALGNQAAAGRGWREAVGARAPSRDAVTQPGTVSM